MITGSCYRISGIPIITQPATGQWLPRNSLGIDGNGHAIYPSLREFEMVWELIDQQTVYQLQGFYNSIGNTGTVVVDLPKFGDTGIPLAPDGTTGTFESYTGCILREPEFGQYFEYHRESANLLIVRIRT